MKADFEQLHAAFPGVEWSENPSPSGQHSVVVGCADAVAAAEFLRDRLGYDFCSNVSGVDWPPRKVKETVVRKDVTDGVEKEIKETIERDVPGYLEAVYHLYSIGGRKGPLVLRMRTADRAEGARVPSLTPVWKSADFQEREAYDLFGITFDGHPDLRRILMWDEFEDFPMRKDYVAPDDYEYEPTPHDEILEKVRGGKEAA